MSAFEVYKDYVALKNHFTKPDYDYIKYNGHVTVKRASFDKRKDKVFFEKLAKNPDVHEFLIANFSVNPKLWIRDLAYSEDAQLTYNEWKKRQQSLTYNLKQDLGKLFTDFNKNFIVANNEHPALLRLYLGGQVTLESLCILLDLIKAKKHWDSKLEYDPVWSEISLKVQKYTPFINYDKEKVKKIVLDYFG